jgi:hypothetical protein
LLVPADRAGWPSPHPASTPAAVAMPATSARLEIDICFPGLTQVSLAGRLRRRRSAIIASRWAVVAAGSVPGASPGMASVPWCGAKRLENSPPDICMTLFSTFG